jgi:hypothetical protein
MTHYQLSTSGDLNDTDLVLIDSPPKGIGLRRYLMALGEPAKAFYPPDPKVFLKDEYPGLKVASLVGNTEGYLIVSGEMKQAVEALCAGVDIEYLPLKIYDHRQRLHSPDCWIVNPLGNRDCLDEAASGVTYGTEGSVVEIKELILDERKLAGAPSLFRVDKDPSKYVVDDRFAAMVKDGGFTNVLLSTLRSSNR